MHPTPHGGPHHLTPGERQAFRGELEREPRTSGLQGAGREPRTADRANAARANEARANEARANTARAVNERGGAANRNSYRGYENRSHAFSGVDRGRQVNREAQRGYSYTQRGHAAPHGRSYHAAAYHGGGHGGGRR